MRSYAGKISAVKATHVAKLGGETGGECPFLHTPGPVASQCGGAIHARLRSQAQQVLHRDEGPGRHGLECLADESADGIGRGIAEIAAEVVEFLGRGIGQPAGQRVVVVGARVNDAMFDIGMGKKGVGRIEGSPALGRIESELENAHPRQAVIVPEGTHFVRDEAQVLGHDRRILPEGGFDRGEELGPRRLPPSAAARGRLARGHRPVGLKPAEMVDPDDIVSRKGRLESADPPGKTLAAVRIPFVQWIAPKLSVGAEVVGRHAGHFQGPTFFVQGEEFGSGPNLCAVLSYEDGNVADHCDAKIVCSALQTAPLLVEKELQSLVAARGSAEAQPLGRDRFRVAAGQIPGPVAVPERPAAAFGSSAQIVFVFDGAEKGVVGEPPGIFSPERLEGGSALRAGALEKNHGGSIEEGAFPGYDRPKIHGRWRKGAGRNEIAAVEQAFALQRFETDEQLVARKRRKRSIGRIAIARGTERQNLPEPLSRLGQSLDEGAGGASEVPDTERSRKGAGVEEYSGRSCHANAVPPGLSREGCRPRARQSI